jgi:hypothetical protein
MSEERLRKIADAVLYEGYILWPYRRSAMKNRRRWTFGGVHPAGWTASGHPDDASVMQTQVPVAGDDEATIEVQVRFLHVVARRVVRDGRAGLEEVDELTVDGERHLSWEEATERTLGLEPLALAALETPRRLAIDLPGGRDQEELIAADGRRAGAIVRSWHALSGELVVAAERRREGLWRLTARIANATPWPGGEREQALERTFCSTHTVVRARGAELVSLTDPPEPLRAEAEACENRGTWPVLAGEPGERHTVLSSPIILSDHPEIAPESPGDLFDGGEIDQLLVLNILSLTDEEKDEMRATDPKAREILERTESLSDDELLGLHGAIREFQAVRAP